jgi:hypothetical protein
MMIGVPTPIISVIPCPPPFKNPQNWIYTKYNIY